MAVLVVTINDPSPAFDKKCAEVQYLCKILMHLAMDLQRGQGTLTSGSLRNVSPAGVANTSCGSWTYTPAAPNP